MIDEDRNIQLFGYTSDELAPKSHKSIIAVCEECGRYQEIPKYSYKPLCKPCKATSPETVAKKSANATEYWSSASARDAQSARTLAYFDKDGAHEKASLCQLKRFSDPLELKKSSAVTKQYYIDHPEARERHSATMQGQDYDAGEWTGFTNSGRSHIVAPSRCIHLNTHFDFLDSHHIISGVVINMPPYIHDSIRHRLYKQNRDGMNMVEINDMAFNYMLTGDC